MNNLFYTAGDTPALRHAAMLLKDAAIPFAQAPDDHVSHLLLPVPSFSPKDTLNGGGDLNEILSHLHKDVVVMGGNLNRPELAAYKTIDLLKDEQYLATNAAITAHCAIKQAMMRMPMTFEHCPVLIIGWGRIGKCLGRLLKGLDADVTVAARKPADRAMLNALGYKSIPIINIEPSNYQVIFNTAPVMVLHGGGRLNVDLASKPGIDCHNVIIARGLPGKDAPESSGRLIAETVLRLISNQKGNLS